MGFVSVLTMAQRLVAERLGPGGLAVDATAGGGVDTLFLARTAGPGGWVYAFDVQESAIARTRERLANAGRSRDQAVETGSQTAFGDNSGTPVPLAQVELFLAGHERMAELVPLGAHGKIRAVMFNLGYLPGGASSVITRPETTLAALEAGLALLAPEGVLTAVLYPGHEGGDTEADTVAQWAAEVPAAAAQTALYRFTQKPRAPYLVALEKR